MMREMGQMISPLTVADHFADLLDGFVLDQADAILRDSINVPVLVTDTVMIDLTTKTRLAQVVLDFSVELDSGSQTTSVGSIGLSTDGG
jgi:LPPG:FO 2-phospho-L-lactate transferase